MKNKTRIGILFGGRSAEHEVSISSARNIYKALDKTKYDVVPLFIDKKGRWMSGSIPTLLLSSNETPYVKEERLVSDSEKGLSQYLHEIETLKTIDVIFPVLHGTYGEDGTIQGLLKLTNIPFVGPSVLGSAVGMDKDIMKRLLRDAKIPIAKFLVYSTQQIEFSDVKKTLGLPLFIKPANLGSSVGVSKVSNESDFRKAIDLAISYDTKIIIEEYIQGREVECSVLGNEEKKASLPGELIISHEFYSYEAKYLDPHGAIAKIPANLPKAIQKNIQELAIQVCEVLAIDSMARVDFFVTNNNVIYVNEVNTIPGFTDISMYPKLWEASGVSQTQLLDELISLAITRYEKEERLETSVTK